MVDKIVEETFLIEQILTPDERVRFLQTSQYRKYTKFTVKNPFASTEQCWYNISEKIGNNKITITNGDDTVDVIIDDGWYASDETFGIIIEKLKEGFTSLGETVEITLVKTTNKLKFTSASDVVKKVSFPIYPVKSPKESSNYILGCYGLSEFLFTTEFISPTSVDLFSDGRFFTMKIRLLQFGSSSYTGEPQSLITLSNKSNYGTYIERFNIMFQKELFIVDNVLSLSFDVVDGKEFPLDYSASIFLMFQIKCEK